MAFSRQRATPFSLDGVSADAAIPQSTDADAFAPPADIRGVYSLQ